MDQYSEQTLTTLYWGAMENLSSSYVIRPTNLVGFGYMDERPMDGLLAACQVFKMTVKRTKVTLYRCESLSDLQSERYMPLKLALKHGEYGD